MAQDQLREIVSRMVAAGESEDNIAAVIKRLSAEPSKPTMTFNDLAAKGPSAIPPERRGEAAKTVDPVSIGAMAGGFAAAPFTAGMSIPGSMAVAGLASGGGAAAGNLIKQATDNKPFSITDTLKDAALQGGLQAAGSGIGAGIARAMGVVAPKILRGILRPSRRLQDEYGADTIVDTAMRERIPVGAQGSAAEASARTSASAAQADELLKSAQDAGVRGVSPRTVVRELRPLKGELKKRVDIGLEDETGDVAARAKSFLKRHTTPGKAAKQAPRVEVPAGPDSVDAAIRATKELGPQANLLPTSVFGGEAGAVQAARQAGPMASIAPRSMFGSSAQPAQTIRFGDDVAAVAPKINDIPLTRAQALKRTAQSRADRTFRAIEKGNDVKDTGALADKAMATGLRKGIEERVPEVAGINQRTQSLYALTQALEDAEARNVGIVGIGNLVGSFAPQLGSRAAFALNSASQAPIRQSGQYLAALLAALGSDGPDR